MKKLFTSESVTEGHPDKICDQISDAIVDAIMEKDPQGRVAAETTVNTGYAMVMGEISTECYIDIQKLARDVICDSSVSVRFFRKMQYSSGWPPTNSILGIPICCGSVIHRQGSPVAQNRVRVRTWPL